MNTTIPRQDAPGDVAPKSQAPATDAPERPKRTRTRNRKPAAAVPAEDAKPTPPVVTAPAPEKPAAPAPEPAQQPRESRPPRNRQQYRDNGPAVVGMGDDTPAFIALSFEERMKS